MDSSRSSWVFSPLPLRPTIASSSSEMGSYLLSHIFLVALEFTALLVLQLVYAAALVEGTLLAGSKDLMFLILAS